MNKPENSPLTRLKQIIIDLQAIEAELRPMSSDKLRNVFVEAYGRAAECIARAAICVKLLEERGESLHGIPQIATLRKVAAGQILPELVWTFAESPGRVDILRAPIPDQQKIAKNPVVPVAEPAEGGGFTTRMVDLTKAPRETVRQVLGPEGLRTPEEQIAYTRTERKAVKPTAKQEPEPISDPIESKLSVGLTKREVEAIRIKAYRLEISPALLARRLMQKGGLSELVAELLG